MTQLNTASPFFGAYNARHINAEEVAQQFVPSSKFWELIALRNSLLIGPRGSGKTHLLKMLQPKALAAWEGNEGNMARSLVTYWSVFTPADINWKTQVESRAHSLPFEHQNKFSNAMFLSHFREAFITCLIQLTRDRPSTDFGLNSTRIEISREKEVFLCTALANTWNLPLNIPSLDGLKLALVEELTKIGVPKTLDNLSPYMFRLTSMSILDVAREIAENFVNATGIYNARWALCFDELEIAPIPIQRDLFGYLRSTDQRFIFKLAISPSNDASSILNQVGNASSGNDFDAIPLWFVDQSEREIFCRRLWEKHSVGTTAATLAPAVILNRSRFQFPNEETSHGSRRYSETSNWVKDFEYLQRIDKTFAEYLKKQDINVSSLEGTSRRKMDSVVRKVAPLVGFRAAYLSAPKNESSTAARRPLKVPPAEVFSGWDVLCLATEGNPRWFSGIASRLILKWTQSPSGKALTREQQVQELQSAAKKFLAWINAIPVETEPDGTLALSLRTFITTLANFFENEILGPNFKADPVLSFKVDEKTPEYIQRLVVTALNIGAIVVMDDDAINIMTSPVGRTFRLVHLLAPIFNLPMRKGKYRSLSLILEKQLGTLEQFNKPNFTTNIQTLQTDQMGLFH
jgi:hypothetical protein